MLTIRTDLAAEARDLWRESAGETTRLPGVRARDEEAQGLPVARVEILDAEGERALGKPPGVYLTLDVAALPLGAGVARTGPWGGHLTLSLFSLRREEAGEEPTSPVT